MTFDEYTERSAHQTEIESTRVGYLGGSDAHIAYRVAEVGVEGLSATDMHRLRVCFGVEKQNTWGGNEYTDRGHAFEDYIDKLFGTIGNEVEREAVMSGENYEHFSVIAHADFYQPTDKIVYECKCVAGKTTQKVESTYYAQLQWYYMLGAEQVMLMHGTDENTCVAIKAIDRNDGYLECMRRGLKAIDDAYDYIVSGEQAKNSVDAEQCEWAFLSPDIDRYLDIQKQIDRLTEQQKHLRGVISQMMNDHGITNMRYKNVECRRTHASVVRTLDTKKVLAAYPDISNGDYYKETQRAGGIQITIHKNSDK